MNVKGNRMLKIEELTDREIIHEGRKTIIYRGKKNGKAVIVKMFKTTFPSPKEISKLRKEYEISASLDSNTVIRPIALEKEDNFLALLYEDIGGYSLSRIIQKINLDLKTKLQIAIKIVEALEFIHRNEVIHMDIKTDNVIVNLEKNLLQIIDFGISTRLSRENPSVKSAENLEGTLPYISPEQTGRMNRSIDYRTDFYSLGVTLYELFTGKLPFNSNDPMELVHYHIAVQPENPRFINSEITPMLSAIILRLMAKNAEDRYQSAYGLKRDLERSLEILLSPEKEFELGLDDKSGKFQIPQKLYGREYEIQTLLNAFYTISIGNSELVIVKGYSGIGKSVLVNEIQKPIVEKRGYFISGKFDQYKRDIPYFAIIQALRELIRQVLTESEENISEWKKSILNISGDSAQILIDIIPEVELLIGKQPVVPDLSSAESQTRFNFLFKEFVKIFAAEEHPLVFFIDDMQWADPASLKFIENIFTDTNSKYLLFISSFRDNEVDETHPLLSTFSNLKAMNTKMETIALKPLELIHVIHLISDTLQADVENQKIQSLADIVFKKTGGNPFFVNEFLKTLYQEKLLNFDLEKGIWDWEISRINSKEISGNVVELIISKLENLNNTSRRVLHLASCIGNTFDLNTLAIVNNVPLYETKFDLAEVIKEELILVLGDGYKYLSDVGEVLETTDFASSIQFKFVHDRIQQAAYSLIPEEEKKQIHLKIGRYILNSRQKSNKNFYSSEIEENVFDIVNHFNIAFTLISDENEKINIAKLNLIAGRKATKSAAFNSALQFINEGIKFVSEKDWDLNYNLLWQLHKEKASCEFTNALLEEAELTTKLLLNKSKTEDEKVEVYKIYVNVLFQANKHQEGIHIMREALKYLKLKIPEKVTKYHIILEYLKFLLKLGRRKPKDLLDLPEIKNKHMLNIVSVLYDATPSAYMVHSDTMAYIGLIMANICLEYGNSIFAPFAYIMVALIEEGILKRFQTAYDYAMMGFQLQEKFPNMETQGRSYFATGNMMLHWVNPVAEHFELVLKGLRIFQEVGNIHWANYSKVFTRTQSIFFNRNLLSDIEEENNYSYKLHVKSNDREVILNQYMIMRFIKTQFMDTFVLPENIYRFDEAEYEKEMYEPGNNIPRCYYFVFKNIELYDKGNFIEALNFGWKGFKILHEIFGILLDFTARFYFNLTYLAAYSQLNRIQKIKYGTAFKINKFLIELSAKKNPDNFLAYKLILLAEENKVKQNYKLAQEFYELANKESTKAGFWHNTGLVNELAAKYYYSIRQINSAEIFMLNARHAYSKWGAINKVKGIDEKYPNLLNSILSKLDIETEIQEEDNNTKGTVSIATQGTKYSTTKVMDFGSIFKASQTLSGEIVLSKLLEKLMKLLLESAGATQGYLLFTNQNQLFMEASGSVSGNEIKVMQSIPLKNFPEISSNVVNFVFRTKQNIVLNDALKEGNFTNDNHFRKNTIRSVLCAPILNQGRLVGIIYLENNLTTGAFTKERIEVLQVLAGQAAISIENANLYNNLEQKVKERTKKLNETLEEVNLLKEKQDGDYYLTSLLLNPLGRNFAVSDNVKIEFFVKQKKQFKYRKWNSEIGGDINTAYNLKLKEKKFIVFANADAMGKSIQGAGGALVFGSVFKSVIERTYSNPFFSNFFPEQWLKSLFTELHKVFVSFDGSMLMSLVLGLIDEQTGFLYYLNVEHPSPILYRNGKASFLPNTRAYFKLGSQMDTGGFMVETFNLSQGDIVILGSDGRDDIILGKNPITNESIINENENEFLSSVESGDGNLKRIYDSILSKGEQMDDLSLLKIEFSKNISNDYDEIKIAELITKAKTVNGLVESIHVLENALENFPESEKILKEIIQLLVNQKKYKEVIEYLERYINICPSSIQYIYYASFCYRKIGKYQNAIDLGERILLRQPNNLNNLQNLSKCYSGLKDEKSYLKIQAKIDGLL